MNILFLARRKWPRVGGVEVHVREITRALENKKHIVKTISEDEIKYPHIKFFGLLFIWFWLWKNKELIKWADIVHCHDVFIWYLPFRFLYFKKAVYTTFHGWEGIWPIPWKNVFLKKLAAKLSSGTIAIGKYITKYYGVRVNKVLYGGFFPPWRKSGLKSRQGIVYVGRLEADTGLPLFLHWLTLNQKSILVNFIGDGSLRQKCQKFGKVYGFTNPRPFLRKADICVPGGYLSYIEAKAAGCKIMIFADNPLKKDYWREIKKVKKFPTWKQVADEYLSLYHRFK